MLEAKIVNTGRGPEIAGTRITVTTSSLLVPTLCVGMPTSTLRVASLIEPSSTNNLMGRTHYRFGEHSFPHFLTCTVVGWLPVFTRPDTVQILLDSWQFLQDHNRQVLLGNVVLENHIHFIASAEDLAKEVMRPGGISAARNYARMESLVDVATDW